MSFELVQTNDDSDPIPPRTGSPRQEPDGVVFENTRISPPREPSTIETWWNAFVGHDRRQHGDDGVEVLTVIPEVTLQTIQRNDFERLVIPPPKAANGRETIEIEFDVDRIQRRRRIRIGILLLIPLIFLTVTLWRVIPILRELPPYPHCPHIELDNTIPLHSINFNRKLRRLAPSDLRHLHGAHYGFSWNDGDNATTKWRPQGITTITSSSTNQTFLTVSWYGRQPAGYEVRGARISIINLSQNAYRHVLLLDDQFCTLPRLHAGGIAFYEGMLHVADGYRHVIRVFDVQTLFRLPDHLYFDYEYGARQVYVYRVPIKPSFLSTSYGALIVGTYRHCPSQKRHVDAELCRSDQNHLLLYSSHHINTTFPAACEMFFGEMQGAVMSANNDDNVLWVTSSYGGKYASHLHVIHFDLKHCHGQTEIRTLRYPPGLEDLHLYNGDLWMLMEFGSQIVFKTKVERLMPYYK